MFHSEKVRPEKASVEGPTREGLPTKARSEKVHRRRPSRRRSTDEVPAREGFPKKEKVRDEGLVGEGPLMKARRRRFTDEGWLEKVRDKG
jgi:hypothetical protein